MREIAIYGAGGFGREVACLINTINLSSSRPKWNLIGFFDDTLPIGQEVSHYGNCLGGIDILNSWTTPISVVVSIGSPNAIQSVVNKITNSLVDFPNIIHPDFIVNDPKTFKIGKGNIIQSGCSVSCDVTIGDYNVMNGTVVLGHDVSMGDFNTFMPAIRVSGNVTIGCTNFFGVGSIILQKIIIGSNIRLGAGSVLMTKPKNGKLYMGNPAKKTEL